MKHMGCIRFLCVAWYAAATAPYPPGTTHGWTHNYQKVRHEPPAETLSIPDLVCSFYLPRPKVAMCLGGAARTFSNHVVYRTIKANLIDAFGADATVFAYLKLRDERGSVLEDGVTTSRAVHTGDTTDAELFSVLAALRHVGVAEERAIIVPGNYSAPYPSCPNYRLAHNGTGVKDSPAYLASLLGQIEARRRCYDLVAAHERRHGMAFDSVVFLRPDLAWPFAVPPWCAHNFLINRKKQDWVWWLMRADAELALAKPHADMYGCARELARGQTVESYFYATLPKLFWTPGGRGDHPQLSGHLVRAPSRTMGATMCKQFLVPGNFPSCVRDEALPRGWNCNEILHGNPYNHGS